MTKDLRIAREKAQDFTTLGKAASHNVHERIPLPCITTDAGSSPGTRDKRKGRTQAGVTGPLSS